jgi:addiction module HigA family antidote
MTYEREVEIMYNPGHPGAILREDVLKPLNMSVTEFAKKLKISRQVLSGILNEKIGISPTMALKLAKSLNTSAGSWLNMQVNYDLWHAKQTVNVDDVEVVNKKEAA